jgi:protocatechuate 3,4-dioxygenase, alpha subunit
MAELLITPSQTIGPFFAEGLKWQEGTQLFSESASGRHIRLQGAIFDGIGKPVSDSLIEFWQPDAAGRFGVARHGTCDGFGRVMTDWSGRYAITTIVPGMLDDAEGRPQAPHILVVIFSRGLLKQVVSRVYFEGEMANAQDPVLLQCGARADTLIARRDKSSPNAYHWDVALQGEKETVFFDI